MDLFLIVCTTRIDALLPVVRSQTMIGVSLLKKKGNDKGGKIKREKNSIFTRRAKLKLGTTTRIDHAQQGSNMYLENCSQALLLTTLLLILDI